jgi:hypothetical protein
MLLAAPPPVPATAAPAAKEVRVRVRSRGDARRLQALRLDTGEVAVRGYVTVVLRGARQAERLRAAGFKPRAPVRPPARGRAAAALPSGRSAYRALDDYEHDMDALVAAHPGLVRKITLAGTSVLGRPIHGVEIATGVDRTDDGRPTVLDVGLHHAREWSSGEMVMEFATELANRATSDARIARLVNGVRTVLIPVLNPDGLVASMAAVAGDPYKRKNCAGGMAGACGDGVDLNRDYGAFWGGPGASSTPTDDTYRGPAPFSEPEARALRDFEATRQLAVVNMTHNFGGQVLYQPGFQHPDEPGLPAGSAIPYGDRMSALGASMAAAAGYTAAPAYQLYDATGAAEDLTYYAQGAFGYTTEVAGSDFHGPFDADVAGQWPGMRELLLREGEAGLDAADHATIAGVAPAGRTLRIAKDVALSTSYVDGGAAQPFTEHLESTLTVPAGGHYRWAVDPSTPPLVLLAGGTQAWTLTCEDGAGTVLQTRRVVVAIGRTATEDLGCGAAVPAGLEIRAVHRSGRRLRVRMRITGGPLTGLRVTLRDAHGHTRAQAGRRRAGTRVTLTAHRALGPGRYRLRLSATAPDGTRVTATRQVRVRR